jgi:hypothetical protein
MTKSKRPLSGGAIANQDRKRIRINIALEALKNLSPKLKFKNRTEIYNHLASTINMYEKQTNTTSRKGLCSRSGVYSIQEIKAAVEQFWLTGILVSGDVELHQTIEAAAKKVLMDKDIEISNLKYKLSEKARFLKEADNNVMKLTNFIESTDIKTEKYILENYGSSERREDKTSTDDNNRKLIEKLCQIIYKLEIWADNLIERKSNGALVDVGSEQEIISAELMSEYHQKVPVARLKD